MTAPVRAYSTARTVAILEALTETPRSIPEIAEVLQFGERSVRKMVQRLAHDGYTELLPDDNHRKRYRIAERGRLLAARIMLAPIALPTDAAVVGDIEEGARIVERLSAAPTDLAAAGIVRGLTVGEIRHLQAWMAYAEPAALQRTWWEPRS
jgi:biotin operon repressor